MKRIIMMIQPKNLILVSLLLLAAYGLFADDMNNSAAAYIRMGIGARTIAMGEAGTATTKDVSSAYWNPAGLTEMKDIEFSSMYNLSMGLDRTYKYAAIGKRFDFGVLALNWINAGVSDIEGYNDLDQPTGFFSNNEHNISISYANRYKRFSFGASPKFYLSNMDDDTQTGFGLDLGLKYDINQYFQAGLMARDLIGKLDDDTIPTQLALGVAGHPFMGVTIAADVVIESKEDPKLNFGAEYWTPIGRDPEADSKLSVVNMTERSSWDDLMSNSQTGLRLGFNEGRFTVGTGLRFRSIQLDYVYRFGNHDIFNDDHIISLILKF